MFTHLCKRKQFDIPTAKVLLAELVAALDLIHKQGVLYRDLKLENILLDQEGHIKLTDFGLSKELKEQRIANSYCGGFYYSSRLKYFRGNSFEPSLYKRYCFSLSMKLKFREPVLNFLKILVWF